jgi:hypothetical protein
MTIALATRGYLAPSALAEPPGPIGDPPQIVGSRVLGNEPPTITGGVVPVPLIVRAVKQ